MGLLTFCGVFPTVIRAMAEQERRHFPPLETADRLAFEGDVARYRIGPEVVRGRTVEPLFRPPWILVKRIGERDEAGVVAVDMIPPAEGKPEEPWLVRGVLRFEGGPTILTRVAVDHLAGSLEVTRFVLARVRLGEIRNRATGLLRIAPDVLEGKVFLGYEAPAGEEQWAKRVSKANPPRRGRKGSPIEHYERIARRYLELADSGRRDVVKTLAEEEQRPYQTVRGWLARCRDLELLAAASKQGRAESRPGPNLYRKEKED